MDGCGSKTQPASPAPDRGLAQPPHLEDSATQNPGVRPQSSSLAAGTMVNVRSISVIDSSVSFRGYVMGIVESDVNGTDGRVAIPAGSHVAVIVRESSRKNSISTLQLGLYSINIGGHQYVMSDGVKDSATLLLTEDAGRGPGHTSVHVEYGASLAFKLAEPVQLH
jgi:hypothetical protein